MSHTHDIDNEDNLFDFDSCEESTLSAFTIPPAMSAPQSISSDDHNARAIPSHDHPSTSEEVFEPDKGILEIWDKGKGVTEPMLIRAAVAAAHDHFEASGPSTSRDSRRSLLLTPLTPSYLNQYTSLYNDSQQNFFSSITQDMDSSNIGASPSNGKTAWKGKEKELPPVLPPLTFSPTAFDYDPSPWTSPHISSPGPSSYASSHGLSTVSAVSPEANARISDVPARSMMTPDFHETPPLKRMPSRRRSLSSLSVHSTQSLAARSMSRIKLKLGSSRTPPGNIARKLLFRRPTEPVVSRFEYPKAQTPGGADSDVNASTPDPWRTSFKVDELDSTIARLSNLRLQDTHMIPQNFHYSATHLKHKGRSQSSPFPISPLDYIPVTSADIFTPFPLIVRNYFDDVFPKELRLQILASLITLHEADYRRAIEENRWSIAKASSSKGKWVGRDKGIRELIRLSRVSKSWQILVFDGQLWVDLDLRSFPNIPESLLLRLTSTGGSFTTTLDISGLGRVSSATLLEITDNLCVNTGLDSLSYTQLTAINLRGCTSLTTRSLHHLLVRSSSLQKLCVKGLPAVTNTTCDILSTYCPQLISLDMGRCMNIDADGIQSFAEALISRGEHSRLKELRLCGIRNINDTMMEILGEAAPYLEVLDLSYARQLHNSALEAFVACDAGGGLQELGVVTIFVSPRDLGREPNDSNKLRRRVTRLRHLSISFCYLITDEACANLAHSVPQLEFLEMAGIGAEIRDDGLVRLLNTTPFIRRLDLEDASNISDSVLAALTPSASTNVPPSDTTPEPGHALEQLLISYATHVTDDALRALIRGCPRLKCLEADNTQIGSAVLKEFVRLCRKRKLAGARAVVVDCRGISEPVVRELAVSTRPRMGWRAHGARKLMYLDARDGRADELKAGQDECDEERVVLKSFYSWQTVDAVRTAREKRRKANSRRAGNESGSGSELEDPAGRAFRWWTPGVARRTQPSGRSSPLNMVDMNGDGCTLM